MAAGAGVATATPVCGARTKVAALGAGGAPL